MQTRKKHNVKKMRENKIYVNNNINVGLEYRFDFFTKTALYKLISPFLNNQKWVIS